MGRPSSYTQEIADEICARLVDGVPLSKICEDDAFPHYATVRRWEAENDEFRALSVRAKQEGTHRLADDCQLIADDRLPDDLDEAKVEIAHRKLRIDTRMRLIGKWNRQDYGDKTLVGSDPDNPLPATFAVNLVKPDPAD